MQHHTRCQPCLEDHRLSRKPSWQSRTDPGSNHPTAESSDQSAIQSSKGLAVLQRRKYNKVEEREWNHHSCTLHMLQSLLYNTLYSWIWVREVPFWNVLVLYGHCPNSFNPPPLCQTGERGEKKVPVASGQISFFHPSWRTFQRLGESP